MTHKDLYNCSKGTNRTAGKKLVPQCQIVEELTEAASLKEKDHDAYLITRDTDLTELQSEIDIEFGVKVPSVCL